MKKIWSKSWKLLAFSKWRRCSYISFTSFEDLGILMLQKVIWKVLEHFFKVNMNRGFLGWVMLRVLVSPIIFRKYIISKIIISPQNSSDNSQMSMQLVYTVKHSHHSPKQTRIQWKICFSIFQSSDNGDPGTSSTWQSSINSSRWHNPKVTTCFPVKWSSR